MFKEFNLNGITELNNLEWNRILYPTPEGRNEDTYVTHFKSCSGRDLDVTAVLRVVPVYLLELM